MKKNKFSKNWVIKQRRDTYVKQSKIDGYRARSAYKLKEIDEKFKIFKGGMTVIDIGAAPGSWSQYVSKVVKSGKLISIDRLTHLSSRKLNNATWTKTHTDNWKLKDRQQCCGQTRKVPFKCLLCLSNISILETIS